MFDPLRFFCDDTFCYPTHGRTVMFFDPQHLTTTGSQLLAPELTGDLRWLLHDVAAGNNAASREGSIPNI
jgi:SGNH domain (fused to AT3 domains)